MNLRNLTYELDFIHGTLKKASPAAVLGGILVLGLGLVFGKMEMVFAGAFVALIGTIEYVIMRLKGRKDH